MNRLIKSGIAVVCCLVACSRSSSSPAPSSSPRSNFGEQQKSSYAAAGQPGAPPASPAPRPADSRAASPRAAATGAQASEPVAEYARKVIRDLELTMEIDALDRFLIEIQRVADQSGGYISESDVPNASGGAARSGTLVLRVPSEAVDGTAERFGTLGRIESRTLRSQDITDQFYDGAARLANQRHYEARLLKLIETHSGRLDELLTLEGQIASVRENIERLEGQQRLWAHQAALATIRLHFHVFQAPVVAAKVEPIAAPTFLSRLGTSFTNSLDALREVAEATTIVLVAFAPWAALMILMALAARFSWKRFVSPRAVRSST